MLDDMNKKGDYKWGIVLSLILGLMVLSLSMYFIFNEYFTDEDLGMEVCRQSIQVRAMLPEKEFAGVTVKSFKEDFPLKCKTMVKTIEKSDVEKDNASEAKRIIAESMAECWYLYGEGDINVFPSKWYGSKSACVPCARIHLTEEAKVYMRKNGNISIREALDLRMDEGISYYTYLRNSGKRFSAFDFGNMVAFDLYGDGFEIKSVSEVDRENREDSIRTIKTVNLKNRFNLVDMEMNMGSTGIVLPEFFNADDGDLLVNYGVVVVKGKEFGDHVPYLFYFQHGQDRSPFNETNDIFVSEVWDWAAGLFGKSRDGRFCSSWEGVPA